MKRNQKKIELLIQECDSICLKIEQLDINSGKDITKYNTLTREKSVLINKLIDHGHFYEYIPKNE
jgi:hypothetical protein